MSRKLKRYFKDVEPGTPCTATIMLFRLNAKSLLERGIIKIGTDEYKGDYVFVGLYDDVFSKEYTYDDEWL